jgi:hypothetical protein
VAALQPSHQDAREACLPAIRIAFAHVDMSASRQVRRVGPREQLRECVETLRIEGLHHGWLRTPLRGCTTSFYAAPIDVTMLNWLRDESVLASLGCGERADAVTSRQSQPDWTTAYIASSQIA